MDRTTPFQPWAANDGVKKDRELLDDAKHHRENVNHPKHTQTASYDKESAVAPSNVPGPSSVSGSGSDPPTGMEAKMDSAKIASMQQFVENSLSPEARQRVSQLLEAVEALSGTERLLLYLRLPTGVPPHDPLKQPVNPLGSRAELQQTVTWIQTHLEVDPDVSLPKQDVYEEYITHCMSSVMKPLSTADFGKVMKQVYPTVRPRRLGTRGNSRYCYAGLRKKIKLEVPQLPDLGESSKETTVACRETERVVCDWAESKLGLKFNGLSELSRHLLSAAATAPRPVAGSPPPLATLSQPHAPCEDPASRQLMKQLKRKIQTHGTPGRPKKYKGQELGDEVAPSTSYGAPLHPGVKHEGEPEPPYDYPETYGMYDVRAGYYPRRPHPQLDYRSDPYQFDPSYAPRDLTLPPADALHNLPINLSSDASLDLSTERAAWQRRRPPEPPPPPPPRLPLPGKKLILETYQSSQEGSPRAPPPPPPPADSFPREYLPKKMRAAEIMGGKLAAARQQLHADAPSTSAGAEASVRSEVAFLEDPKNVSSRSTSTAAALAREEQEAASPTRPAEAPTCRASRARPAPAHGEQDCCTLAGISLRSGVICQEKHSEILTRERVISICNIDKHDLDDYLNETSSQENEEELLHYFHRDPDAKQANTTDAPNFLETRLDPQDDHSQGKNEKICQLRELLAKNLKNQSGSSFLQKSAAGAEQPAEQAAAFKPVAAPATTDVANGPSIPNPEVNRINSVQTNGTTMPTLNENGTGIVMTTAGTQLYNGNGHHNVPQSPTTRTQAYDFVPINDGCHSPRTFNSKSPLGFGHRGLSPTKVSKCAALGGSLQTSPVPHSSAASPFVSPRNTPVPRSRACSRPIPKHNGRKRRNPLTLGVGDPCQPFAIPNEQKFIAKSACVPGVKYCQPMSAPPSPNIVSCHYKNQLFQCATGITNGNHHVPINFLPTPLFRETAGPELLQPHSADPLSSEVSQFFHESLANYRAEPDAFRSQSVPLKPGMHNIGMQYNKTPIGSVPPTPVPNEFCDFGSLADTCDISKAGLNPETLDKIYDAIDSSNDVLNAGDAQTLLSTDDSMVNGCDMLPEQQILTDEINSLIPGGELLDRGDQFSQSYEESPAADNVEDFLKRTNSIEFDLSDLVSDKNKYYMSRSVPSTPLPSLKRAAPTLQLDPRRARELFAPDSYSASNGLSSKSVPSTPQLVEEKSVFNYGNRDFLINGNSVETCSNPIHVVDSQEMTSPLHEILREDILEPLTPATDLMSDLDKMEPPYVDI